MAKLFLSRESAGLNQDFVPQAGQRNPAMLRIPSLPMCQSLEDLWFQCVVEWARRRQLQLQAEESASPERMARQPLHPVAVGVLEEEKLFRVELL